MFIEWTTGRNLFSLMGGVPEFTRIREGRLRCQGAFSHPILAGVFGACWLPIFIALYAHKARALAICGGVGGLLIVFFSSSSTPVLGAGVALVGASLWHLRDYVPWMRRLTYAFLIVLHFTWKHPVWYLLARINVVGGSTGYHRYNLIDKAIKNFDDWWLVGTSSTNHWGWFLYDITNEYVLAGVRGGVLSMLLLIAILVFVFSGIGKVSGSRQLHPKDRLTVWMIGSMIAVHAACFFAVSYFGQMTSIWYLHLAIAGSYIELHRHAVAKKRRAMARQRRQRELEPAVAT